MKDQIKEAAEKPQIEKAAEIQQEAALASKLKKGQLVAVMVIEDGGLFCQTNKWKVFKVKHISDNYHLFALSGHGQSHLGFLSKDEVTSGFFQVRSMLINIKPLSEFTFWKKLDLILFH